MCSNELDKVIPKALLEFGRLIYFQDKRKRKTHFWKFLLRCQLENYLQPHFVGTDCFSDIVILNQCQIQNYAHKKKWMNDPPFYKTDNDRDFRLLYLDSHKIRHRELYHLCSETFPVGRVVDRRTAPYDLVNEDILKKKKMFIFIEIIKSLNGIFVLYVLYWSNLFLNKKIGPID